MDKNSSIKGKTTGEPVFRQTGNVEFGITDPEQIYFNQLVYVAKMGLEGEYPQTELAKKALEELREEILITEGVRVKNIYIMRLGLCALVMAMVSIALGFVFYAASLGHIAFLSFLNETYVHPYFFVFAGAMAGSWISCGIRKEKLIFKDLAVMEEDMLKNIPRLCFAGVTSVLFLLFIKVLAIDLSIGNIKVSDVMDNIEMQIFIGAIAGLLGNKLSHALANKASHIIDPQASK